jgi:hypothetical protein
MPDRPCKKIRIAITGCYCYDRLDLVCSCVRRLAYWSANQGQAVVIVAGMAPPPPRTPIFSVDEVAIEEALRLGLETASHAALWRVDRDKAVARRDTRLLADCDHVVVFWDVRWRETAALIEKATASGKLAKVYGLGGAALDPASAREAAKHALAVERAAPVYVERRRSSRRRRC